MYWLIFIAAGVTAMLYKHREYVKKTICIAHYEAIYWILGGAAMLEDIFYASKNKLEELPKRSNEIALVTGGSRGIGLEVVKKLLGCDMHVIIGCRNVQAGLDAIERLRKQGITSGKTDVIRLDTSSFKSVQEFSRNIQSKINHLHILINNAGIMFVPQSITEDEVESHFAVNYLGHALLTHLLLPLLQKAGRDSVFHSRIVHVSSCAHLAGSINFDDINYTRNTYIPSEAYAQSKLAQIMFSNALDRKLSEKNARVRSISVHPGVVDTELFDGTLLKRIAPWAPKIFFKTPEAGSTSIVFCALSESLENVGGIYVSNCRVTRISSSAKDVVQQERLMRKTQELLKLRNFCAVTE